MADWDTPANGTWAGKYKKNYSSSNYITRVDSWRSVPWAVLCKNCESASSIAVDEAEAERLERYNAFIEKKEAEEADFNPEAGSYEGNLSDKYPYTSLNNNDKTRIKRKASAEVIEQFVESNNLKAVALQLLPMVITFISTYKLSTVSGDDYDPRVAEACYKESIKTTESTENRSTLGSGGFISGAALYKSLFQSEDATMGLYYFLMSDARGKYLEKQYKSPAKSFSSLVPIILYAFKLVKGIPYHHWYRGHIIGMVNLDLADAMLWDDYAAIKPDDATILEARNIGLMTKSGLKAGTVRDATYTFKLYGTTAISNFPHLVQVMYSQIWVAHPVNRTKYMVLDPSNWDIMPPALVSEEILMKPAAVINDDFINSGKNATTTELLW